MGVGLGSGARIWYECGSGDGYLMA
jgi:hypothetical protein